MAKATSAVMKVLLTFMITVFFLQTNAQLTGTYTIPGAPYSTISAAITALNSQGVGAGGVTFNITAGATYTETLPVLTATGTAANPIVFQRSGAGSNPRIVPATAGTIASSTTLGSNGDGVFVISGGDYITIDGIDLGTSSGFTTATTMYEYGYYLKKASATDACKNIVIRNCAITLNKTAIYSFGIFVSNISGTATVTVTSTGGRSENVKIYNNTISGCYGGIQLRGYAASTPYDLYDQNIEVGEDGANTITDFGGSSTTVYGIYTIYQNNLKIANNTVTSGTGNSSTLYGIFNSTANAATVTMHHNTVTITGGGTTSTIYAINNAAGGSGGTVKMYNNTVTGVTYGSATSASVYLLYNTATADKIEIYNNSISNNTLPGTGSMYCIYNSGAIVTDTKIYGNTVSGNTKTSTGTMYCVYNSPASTCVSNIDSNVVSGNAAGGGTMHGIYFDASATTNVYQNKIYDQTSTGTAGAVYGITVPSGPVTTNIYNNFISDLKTPTADASTDAVRGISISGSTASSAVNLSYNSIYLKATSTGTNFSTSGIYHSGSATSTTANLKMLNNIVVNVSTAKGTGNTVVFRRGISTATNLNSATATNLYYAGTPGTAALIYTDGTNSDQTLYNYKQRMGAAEAGTVTEMPPFINSTTTPYDLHLNTTTPTQAEGKGTPVSGITKDFDNDARNATTPDIGADEMSGTTATAMSYSSSAVTQFTGRAYKGVNNQQIIRIAVTTTGTALALTASKFTVNANGSTSVADISSAKLFYTGTSAVFSTNTLFGSSNAPSLTTFDINGSQVLSEGTNYFWLTYDVPAGATANNTLDAECTAFVLDGSTVTVASGAPSGNKTIMGPMSGTYQVSPSQVYPGYVSLTEATNDLLLRGVNGPVIFDVLAGSGPYNEQVILTPVTGASAVNTITYNGNHNTVSDNSGAVTGERAVFKLNGADYITINNFVINTGTGTYGYGVQLLNDADYNTISNCSISTNLTSTSAANYAGIVINASASPTNIGTSTGSSLCDNNTIISDTTSGGYCGIAIIANGATSDVSGNKIQNCLVQDFYEFGIILEGNNGTLVEGNDLSRPTRATVTNFRGIALSPASAATAGLHQSLNCIIRNNRIHDPFTSATSSTSGAFGFYSYEADATVGNENIFANNIIYNFTGGTGASNRNGILNVGTSNIKYYHNTIVLDDASYSGTGGIRGFYQQSGVTGSTTASGIDIRNNIFYISQGGTGARQMLYFELNPSSTFICNNNDYYFGVPGDIGYMNATTATTLAAWQTLSGGDNNSKTIDPFFTNGSSGNFSPLEVLIDNMGTPLGISTDINGNARSSSTPDVGAYEFTPPVCTSPPTAGTSTSNASAQICPNSNVTLNLQGYSVGTGQTYQWQVSSTLAGTYSNVGTSQTAPSFVATPLVSGYYRCAVTCSGNTGYSVPVFVDVREVFAGDYTINHQLPSSGRQFKTFNDAVTAMQTCGITGAVKFTVEIGSGPYPEQVTIPAISGTSATNTITFKGNLQTLTFNSTTSTARAGIVLNGADYVTIDSLNIDGSQGTYAWGIVLTGQADNNTISNCNVTVSSSNTSSGNHIPFVINGSVSSTATGGNNGNNNTISNNVFTGGYYAVYVYGSSSTQNLNNTFSKNVVQDFYAYGFYSLYNTNLKIQNNDIQRPNRTSSTSVYCVYLSTGTLAAQVEKNRIHNMFDALPASTSSLYGFYCSATATSGNENRFINNAVYSITSNGSIYGIYNSTAPYTNYYHNTIALTYSAATTGATYGFYQTGATSNIQFKNNIVVITRGGDGLKYAVYLSSAATTLNSNNNVFFVNSAGSGAQNIGYLTQDQQLLSDWQSATLSQMGSSQDLNSISTDPIFINPSQGDFTPVATNINNIGANVGVTTDILDSSRTVASPDPGAWEFHIDGCVNPVLPGLAIADPEACSGVTFQLDLTGNTTGEGQTYQWQSSTDNNSWNNFGPSQIISLTTTSQTVNTYYRCAVTCAGGTTEYSQSVYVISPSLVSGTYTINNTLPTGSGNFTSFNDAINFIRCGINGPVVFNVTAGTGPYNERFEIPLITGASATNTITFNGNGTTVNYQANTSSERAAIVLNGADYVTFDSLRVDVSGGTYGWGMVLMNQADNNTIRKCTVISASNSTSSNYAGIMINGSAASTAGTGNNANNTTITETTVVGGYYGIYAYGASATYLNKNVFSNNTLKDQYTAGIYTVYSDSMIVSGNDVSRPGRNTTTTIYGVYVSSGTAVLVEKNRVHNLFDGFTTTSTAATYGFYLTSSGTAAVPNRIENNAIYNIVSNGTIYGIYSASYNYNNFYHNTINLDDTKATAGTTYGAYVYGTSVNLKNNLIQIKRGGTGTKYCIYASSGTANSDYNSLLLTSAAGTNNYGYQNSTAYATFAAWKAVQDSHSVNEDALFTNIPAGDLTPNNAVLDGIGTNVNISTDITGASRTVASPDPGAWEFTGGVDLGKPVITYTALGYTCSTGDRTLTANIADARSGIRTIGSLVPRVYYKKVAQTAWMSVAGILTLGDATSGTWKFTISSGDLGGVNLNDTIQYYVLAQDTSGNIISNPLGANATDVNTVISHAPVPNTYRVATLGGIKTVGTGGDFPNLTAAVNAFNNSCLTSAVVFELTNTNYTEAGQITINKHADASAINTLTIRPATGITANLAGAVSNGAFLRVLNDYTTIEGSNSGTTSRNLTITNSSTSAPTVLLIGSSVAATPVVNVVVKNTIIVNGANTSSAVIVRDSSGSGGYFNNITFQNSSFQKAYYGLYVAADSQAGNGTGLVITGNNFNTSGTNAIRYGAVYAFGTDGASITNNTIGNFDAASAELDKGLFIDASSNATISGNTISGLGYTGTGAYAAYGIYINQTSTGHNITGNTITNISSSGTVAPAGIYLLNSNISGIAIQKNKVSNIKNTNTTGYGAFGIWLASSSTAAATTVSNNFIWDVAGYGSNTSGRNGYGINISAGAGYNIYHNSVNLNSNQTSATGLPAALNITNGVTAAAALNVVNNMFINNQTVGTQRYAIYSDASNSVFGTIDYNDYFTTGPNLAFIGTNRSNLIGLQTGFGGNTNSINTQPIFVGSNDLHVDAPFSIAYDNKGTALATVTTDIDGEVRSAATPDIGADEFVATNNLDAGITALIAPAVQSCYTAAETVTVTIRNQSATALDLTANPVTLNASVTGPNATTFTPVVINTGTLNAGATMNVVISNTYDMSVAGTYGFSATLSLTGDVNAGNNTLATTNLVVTPINPGIASADVDAFCITGGIPTITVSNNSNYASVQWQESVSPGGPWTNVGTNSSTYSPVSAITDTRYYRALSACGTNNAPSNVVTVTLNNPQVTGTTPGVRCGPGVVSLGATASSGATLNWYNAASGGSALATGSPYSTPSISSTTSYYVSAISGGGGTQTVGALNTSIGSVSAVSSYYMNFTVSSTLTLRSVECYFSSVGAAYTLNIRKASDASSVFTSSGTTSVSGTATPQVISLNATLQPGDYQIGWTTDPGTYRNSTGGSYPYQIPGLISITGNTFNSTAYYYYFYKWTVSTGCESARTPVVATINNANSPAAGAAGTTECSSAVISGATAITYSDCDLITTIMPSGATAISGSVNACVKIDNSVQTAPTGEPYVQRHFDITPAVNATTATSTITLYFLQSEFNAFNAARGGFAALPTASGDATGIANLRITQYNGTGTAPGNYTGAAVQIDPADANIVWNNTDGRWEVTFNAAGGGGFYVHSGAFVLPVTIVTFRGEMAGSANRLFWTTSTEADNKGFELERSADGSRFTKIDFIATKANGGNSTAALNYSFDDVRPLQGANYYRLKQVDNNGKFNYSNVVLLSRKVTEITLARIYPNPASGELNVEIVSPTSEKLTLVVTDLSGKVVMQHAMNVVTGDNKQQLQIRTLAAGTYVLKAVCANGCETAALRFVKQ